MVIKQALYTGTGIIQLTSGSPATLTSTDPHVDTEFEELTFAARHGVAWFEGRLWLCIAEEDSGTYNVSMRRYNNDTDDWDYPPGGSQGHLTSGSSSGRTSFGSFGLISFRDAVHVYFQDDTTGLIGGSAIQSLGHSVWQPDPATNGTLTNQGTVYSRGFLSKSNNEHAGTHVLDLIEHNGTIYIALNSAVLSQTPPVGSVSVLEQMIGTNMNTAPSSKSFGTFVPASGSEQLFMVQQPGLLKQITGTVTQVADFKNINSNIGHVGRNADDPGVLPGCVQVGTEFFVFFIDTTTGVVMYKHTDPTEDETNWTDATASLPSAWSGNVDTHIKIVTDPSENGLNTPDGEVRVMFEDNSSGAFDVYSFDGSAFTLLGSGSGPTLSVGFFDPDAVDVEMEESPNIDSGVGTATFTYQLFREASATSVSLEAEYSTNGGGTWSAAEAATGSDGITAGQSGTITGLTASDSRPTGDGDSFTFVWAFENDLGSGVFTNVRFRIRST